MRIETTRIHGDAHDEITVDVRTEQVIPYAVVNIDSNENALRLFAPSGLNLTADYLRELRDAIDGAIAELVQMEKNWEMKIDDEKHEEAK